MEEIKNLQARVAELEAKLAQAQNDGATGQHRQKIAHMSAEVVDSNPYR